MKMLDLFSGIGGFSLAASWVWGDDLEIAGFCEIDKYAQKVLKKNFPGVPIFEDIQELDGKRFTDIDLITGGFPCQDISIAGKGEGIEGSRSGLWSEMHRVISEIRPRYALIENVPMLIHRGLERVLCDLAQIGYDAEWQIVGADDVGAWHRRKRIWIVAYPNRDRTKWNESENGTGRRPEQSGENVPNSKSKRHRRRDSEECGIEGREFLANKQGRSEMGSETQGCGESPGDVPNSNRKRSQRMESESQKSQRSDKQTGLQGGTGNGGWWDVEPDVGRVAHGIPKRVDRLRGLGNAIVPQVVYEIMKKLKLSTTAISTTT